MSIKIEVGTATGSVAVELEDPTVDGVEEYVLSQENDLGRSYVHMSRDELESFRDDLILLLEIYPKGSE